SSYIHNRDLHSFPTRRSSDLTEKRNKLSMLDDSIEDTIESLKSDYIEVLNEQASAKNEINYLNQQLNQQIMKSNRLDGENEKYIEQRSEITQKLHEATTELKEVESAISEQLALYEEIQKNIASLKEQYESQLAMINQANQYIQKAQARKETLEEMNEDYTGFYHGVKEVLKAKNHTLEGIEGAVA